MAKVAIKIEYAAGDLSSGFPGGIDPLRTAVVDAGFHIVSNTSSLIEFMQAGTTPVDQDDDTPHWAIELVAPGFIKFHTIYGPSFSDPAAKVGSSGDISPNPMYYDHVSEANVPSPAEVYFVADGVAGTWWFAYVVREMPAPPEDSVALKCIRIVVCGLKSRRYPQDNYQGLVCRYGLYLENNFIVPYSTDSTGAEISPSYLAFWTPIGRNPDAFIRYAGHPMPKMFAPVFPSKSVTDFCASYMGELEGFYMGTTGYAMEEEPAANMVAIVGEIISGNPPADEPAFILPLPLSFTVL